MIDTMSEDLLYDKKDIVPDDSGLMKRKGIEPYKNVVISDENGNELVGAYLDYVGSKIIVIQLLSIWDAKKLEGKSDFWHFIPLEYAPKPCNRLLFLSNFQNNYWGICSNVL